MEKKQLKKLSLKKEVISSLSSDELKSVKGGWTTTIGDCSKVPCCEQWTVVKSCNVSACDDCSDNLTCTHISCEASNCCQTEG